LQNALEGNAHNLIQGQHIPLVVASFGVLEHSYSQGDASGACWKALAPFGSSLFDLVEMSPPQILCCKTLDEGKGYKTQQ
jgi:hypothetical protein